MSFAFACIRYERKKVSNEYMWTIGLTSAIYRLQESLWFSILTEFGVPTKLLVDRLIKVSSNETYSKEHMGTQLSHVFPIQKGLQQRDALSSVLFNFTLKYNIRCY
jgi:hypothetical protein